MLREGRSYRPSRDIRFSGILTRPSIIRSILRDSASVLLRFVGGARGVVTVSQVSAGRKNQLCFEIDGSNESSRVEFDGSERTLDRASKSSE